MIIFETIDNQNYRIELKYKSLDCWNVYIDSFLRGTVTKLPHQNYEIYCGDLNKVIKGTRRDAAFKLLQLNVL